MSIQNGSTEELTQHIEMYSCEIFKVKPIIEGNTITGVEA